jgi:hypothetical protein
MLCSPAFAVSCWVPVVQPVPGEIIQRDMFIVSGKRCTMVVGRSLGPMYGVRLIAPPGNGRISTGSGRITYMSREGYFGDDRFVFARDGIDSMNKPMTWTIDMHVHVKQRL